MSGITLVGLGPGTPEKVTREAWDLLCQAKEVWLLDARHPVAAGLPGAVKIRLLAQAVDEDKSAAGVDSSLVSRVIRLGHRSDGVIVGLPGHPILGASLGISIVRRAREVGLPTQVIGGLPIVDSLFTAPEMPLCAPVAIWPASALMRLHASPCPPDTALIVSEIGSKEVAQALKDTLLSAYPAQHPVRLVNRSEEAGATTEEIPLGQVVEGDQIGPLSSLYVPPMESGHSIETLQEVVAHLRAPDGCPWDREQTHASLRRHLLEEAYEAVAAMDEGDADAMREELGDLLLQIVLNAQIAAEGAEFTFAEVAKGIHDKIVRRHPHVFADVEVEGVEAVLANWERLKEDERDVEGRHTGLLDGVPRALPALSQAQEYQERAARVGFDWPEIAGVLDKISEEIQEVREATDGEVFTAEVGDLLFALVNLSRWREIDAEAALRAANARFAERFRFIELAARRQERRLSELTLDEMERLWEEAKEQQG